MQDASLQKNWEATELEELYEGLLMHGFQERHVEQALQVMKQELQNKRIAISPLNCFS